MKKTIIALALASFGVVSSQAASTINYDFGALKVGANPLSDGSAVYLFVSTTGAATDLLSLQTQLVGVNLNVGSLFGGDKLVLSVTTPSIGSFGVAGTGNGVAADIIYANGISSGDALGLLWINQPDGPIGNSKEFGVFTSPSITMPVDGSNVSVSFLEVDFGGTIPNGGITTNGTTIPVPEPSAALLGALGALGLLRRRRN